MDRPSSLFLQFFRQVVLRCRYTLHHPYILLLEETCLLILYQYKVVPNTISHGT